jgi:aminoglycoside phosphotransferase family enzyme/predicted kinase
MAADYTHFAGASTGARQRFAASPQAAIMDPKNHLPREGSSVTQALITALQNPALYPHPAKDIQLIETHISWVLLTGEYAYKIKKPMNFGFLDFTDLAKRKHFCGEELRLNQRLTEGLYLEVLPITGSAEAPQLNGDGPVIEYALKMRQFPQEGLLSTLQANGELHQEHIDALATQIAHFHLNAPHVPQQHHQGTPEAVMEPVQQNFDQIRPFLSDKADLQQLDALQDWARSSFDRLKPLLAERKAQGFIRECHGDIHLGNATVIDGKVVIFDCIEFNEPFRFTDVWGDTGFLAMDLEDRGLKSLARRFVSQYLELTGDYEGLHVLNFYKAYRAMVRAKVALFSMPQGAEGLARANGLRQYRRYADLAESYSAIPSRFLAITSGVSAVGKSHVAMRTVEALGAVRLRSDVERKRLFGEQQPDADKVLQSGIYNADASIKTYAHLHKLADSILAAGFPVTIDATYLKHEQRQAAANIAETRGVPYLILDCNAPEPVIAAWLQQRQSENNDPSDATLEVIQAQLANREPLTAEETLLSKRVETNESDSLDKLVRQIRDRLPGL